MLDQLAAVVALFGVLAALGAMGDAMGWATGPRIAIDAAALLMVLVLAAATVVSIRR